MIDRHNYEKHSSSNLWMIYIIVFSIILIPDIRITSLPAFRVEQVIVVICAIFLYMKLMLRKKTGINRQNIRFPVLYLSFSFFIILSILVGSIKGIKVLPSDFFELYKIFIYLGIYLIILLTIKNEKDKLKILKFTIFILLISVAIATQQYFNLFNLNEKYVQIIAPTQFRTLVNNYPFPRVIGMTSNPNEYAVMPGIGAILSWGLYLKTKEKKNILYMMVFIVGVLMTLSRSGFLFMSVGIIMFTFLYLFSSNISNFLKGNINLKAVKVVIFSVVFLITIGTIIFNFLPQELTWRLMRGINIGTDSSFQARLSNWEEHIVHFKSSPIFGLGPAKSIEYEHSVDNEWLLFLKRYGIVGTIYIVFIFIFPVIKSKRSFFKYLYLSILIGSAIYMIPSIIYNCFQIMPLIMILAALVPDSKIIKKINSS
ncbi:O-antigen ligase family protein [Desulfofalx alkaliphila]|uniref:O-antigen ligase family protein n=1 Tax=Desulfofalx alkaliphila TaxID=105483 RepID=UPI0004E20C87|nr:O-antigen ligase family protein [Desulfofalx alkaliphila]